MFIKSSLARWACVVTIGLCANLAHASDHNQKDSGTRYQGSCTDNLLEKFNDCRQAKSVSLAAKDTIGAQHTKCQLSIEQYRECQNRERFQMKEEFDKMRSKKNDTK
ncbi:MAG: hypothetical protein BGO76_04095 [Caedibacter sp. 38-128]|nr:hypothetical protein [Holosporales bacterium]OJX08035.1 MAG: hypothetical protein BGO76_04095 [Caedibacter sp. 38-128]